MNRTRRSQTERLQMDREQTGRLRIRGILMTILMTILLMAALLAFAGCGDSGESSQTDQAAGDAASQTEATIQTEAPVQTDAATESVPQPETSKIAGSLGEVMKESPAVMIRPGSRTDSGYDEFVVSIDEPDGYANVRVGRGTDTDVVGKLYNGTVVTVLAPTNDWLEIVSGQYKGRFIHKSTVNFSWSDEDTVFRQFVSSSDGEANIRKGRGTGYDVVGKLYNGTSVYVSDLKDGWYQIRYGEFSGYYIHKSMLSDQQPDMARTEVLYVSEPDGYANVRLGRGTDYDVVGKLPNGAAVVVTDLRDGWYRIAMGGMEGGFIHKSTLVR